MVCEHQVELGKNEFWGWRRYGLSVLIEDWNTTNIMSALIWYTPQARKDHGSTVRSLDTNSILGDTEKPRHSVLSASQGTSASRVSSRGNMMTILLMATWRSAQPGMLRVAHIDSPSKMADQSKRLCELS